MSYYRSNHDCFGNPTWAADGASGWIEDQAESPPPERYEADSEGRVYAEYADGSILPTGMVVPSLRSQSNITPAVYKAHIRESYS